MRALIGWAFLGVLLRPAAAQTPPGVAEILDKVNATYKSTLNEAYEVQKHIRGRADAAGAAETFDIHLIFKPPDKFRMEVKGVLDPSAPQIDELQLVSDGSSGWEYSPKTHQYRTYSGILPDLVNPDVVGDTFGIWEFGRSFWRGQVRLVREDHADFQGHPADCWVFEDSNPSGKMRIWVEKSGYSVIRLEVPEGVTDIQAFKLNLQVPDEQFEFKPPEGARRIDAGVPFGR